MSCSCPDSAGMCKHIAAVLYAVGAKLDSDPKLFFTLRDIQVDDLIRRSVESRMESMLKNANRKSPRVLSGGSIPALFGLEE